MSSLIKSLYLEISYSKRNLLLCVDIRVFHEMQMHRGRTLINQLLIGYVLFLIISEFLLLSRRANVKSTVEG